MVSNKWITGIKADGVKESFKVFIRNPVVQKDMEKFKSEKERLDDVFFSLFEVCNSPDNLRSFVKFILILSHGSAFVERSDVDILRRCCLEFRRQFIDVANVDPFCYVTIASACMAVFRSNHIKPYSIAMVPVNGYTSGNFNMNCIRWLDFLSWKDGIEIKYALNGNGEMKIGKFDVDGFCEEQNTIYQ
ncbi:hypothetical protein AVEN_224457-1 [Araneus ventricosus]|uniref:Uncharacterized protein n=1 Tax=Araneus ventricosus TaxID=182803 RepID=A0A4Y2RH07_ARAVE|nr:hypothetical protein AVEN_224457-1 [Araneus ventricosus]